jgi:hypothetical protein
LAKLAIAADSFASSIAVTIRATGAIYIHGLLDQGAQILKYVHFESDAEILRPGTLDVEVLGPARLRVWHRYVVIGALQHDGLTSKPIDVLQQGPVASAIRRFAATKIRAAENYLPPYKTRAQHAAWVQNVHWRWVGTISRLLLRIQRYAHGGALLIVPPNRPTGHLRIKYPIRYERLGTAVIDLAFWKAYLGWCVKALDADFVKKSKPLPRDLFNLTFESALAAEEGTEELSGCLAMVASLSRIDGAVVLDGNLCVLGFGVELRATTDPPTVWLARSALGSPSALSPRNPAHFGMRHRSMFRYCMAHPDAIGFVVSQDSDIRCVKRVGARVLYWENVHTWTEHVKPRPRTPVTLPKPRSF